MNKRKLLNCVYRIVIFTILHSFIVTMGFVSLYISFSVLQERGLMNWKIQIGLIQVALAICFLQVWNILYWICDINLFSNKLYIKHNK